MVGEHLLAHRESMRNAVAIAIEILQAIFHPQRSRSGNVQPSAVELSVICLCRFLSHAMGFPVSNSRADNGFHDILPSLMLRDG